MFRFRLPVPLWCADCAGTDVPFDDDDDLAADGDNNLAAENEGPVDVDGDGEGIYKLQL